MGANVPGSTRKYPEVKCTKVHWVEHIQIHTPRMERRKKWPPKYPPFLGANDGHNDVYVQRLQKASEQITQREQPRHREVRPVPVLYLRGRRPCRGGVVVWWWWCGDVVFGQRVVDVRERTRIYDKDRLPKII